MDNDWKTILSALTSEAYCKVIKLFDLQRESIILAFIFNSLHLLLCCPISSKTILFFVEKYQLYHYELPFL